MHDENTRTLERRWRQSGAVVDQAAWWQAELRGGRAKAATLGLAAFCKHPAARLVIPFSARAFGPDAVRDRADSWEWVDAKDIYWWTANLARWGDDVVIRSVVALAEAAARERFKRALTITADGVPVDDPWELLRPEARPHYMNAELREAYRAVMAGLAWVECQCEEHQFACAKTCDGVRLDVNCGDAWWRMVPAVICGWVQPREGLHLAVRSAARFNTSGMIATAIATELCEMALVGYA